MIDFLKVLRFSFPVQVVGPSAKDFYPLHRAKFIYRRNFPPVGFIQSRTVLLMRRQSNPIMPHETRVRDLNCFDPNSTVYFLGGFLSISFYRLYSNTN